MGAKLKDLPKIIEQALKSKPVLNAAGKSAVRAIQKRTRVGKGVADNLQPPQKLPPLSKTTKKIRNYLKKQGKLNGLGATPGKSNLTRTGQLISDITFKIIQRAGTIIIGFKTKRSQDIANELADRGVVEQVVIGRKKISKTKRFFSRSKKKTTATKKTVRSEYKFMNLSNNEFKRVVTAMSKTVEQILKKINITDL